MTFKRIAHNAIKGFVKRAPWGVRNALVQGLAERGGHEILLTHIARRAGISAFMANGNWGLIQASSTDAIMLPVYGQTRTWAAPTVAFLQKALEGGGGTYLDIGANIGLTTIPIAQNANVRCIAFEPDATNFMHLSENVKRNCPYGNVELLQKAVMDKSGTVTFGLNPDGNPGDHRVIRGATSRKVLSLQAVALDEVFKALTAPLVVKNYSQGAEPFVIAGGRSILSKAQAIALEFWPYGLEQMGGSLDEVYSLIRQFGTVVVTKANSDDRRAFTNPEQAIVQLSRYVRETRSIFEGPYWDVHLMR